MRFPHALALIFAAMLCAGCDFGVPANIKAPSTTDHAETGEIAPEPVARPRHLESRGDRYADAPLVDDRYSDETPSVTDALSDEADEIAQRFKKKMVKQVDSLGDRFESAVERGLKKLDEASSEAYEDPDQR